ncbi:MAG: hypothetical protein ABL967_08275 [Bryobacteraceae bacterium]
MRVLMSSLMSVLLISNVGFADTIAFRDGRTVKGTFMGGDTRSIRVAVGDRVETYSLGDVTNIFFEGAAAATAAPAPAPEPVRAAPAPVFRPAPQESASVRRMDARVIPNGTVLTIRMIDDVDSQTDDVGKTYRASLDESINDTSGNLLVAKGADVTVKLVDDQESGKIQGKTVLTLDVVSLRVDGRDVEVDTATVTQESASRTARSGKVIGGTAALGAIIGAIAGGGKGAAIGAASGAGAGTAVQVMTKGQRVRIPSETRLTFTLQQAVRL